MADASHTSEARGRRLPVLRRSSPPMQLDYASAQGRGANNFDLLRLFGAGCVLFSHAFILCGHDEPIPLRLKEDWGSIGVLIFFAISGFLIARSWAYDSRPLSFAVKRALRLMPALIVSLLVTALILGPLVSTLPLKLYLENPGTKAFIINNATLQTNYGLPGVFATTKYPGAVNGSLWTLPLELKAYCMVLLLGLLALYGRRRLLMPIVAAFVAALMIASLRDAIPFGNRLVAMLADIQAGPPGVAQARAGAYTLYIAPFVAFTVGAALFSVARWIPLRWDITGVLVVGWLAAVVAGGNAPAIVLAVIAPYVILIFAFRTSHLVRLPARFGDYSYGVYIYAFVVQQTIADVIAPASGWVMLVISAPVALGLAVLSWHFVEAPALTLKQGIARPLAVASHEALHPPERVDLGATPVGDIAGNA